MSWYAILSTKPKVIGKAIREFEEEFPEYKRK